MNEIDRLAAIEAIRQVKHRYFRGVDTNDGDMVRAILAEDCVLDYRGCCTDPVSGKDYLPAMNVVLRGAASWTAGGLSRIGITSVHQSHGGEVDVEGDDRASAIWSMTDHLFMPAGAEYSVMTGHGYYHETYEKIAGAWRIRTLRIQRLKVDGF